MEYFMRYTCRLCGKQFTAGNLRTPQAEAMSALLTLDDKSQLALTAVHFCDTYSATMGIGDLAGLVEKSSDVKAING